MFFNRTDLRKAVSGAKFDAESDFEVRLAVDPPRSIKNDEELIPNTEKFPIFFYVSGTLKRRSRLKFNT